MCPYRLRRAVKKPPNFSSELLGVVLSCHSEPTPPLAIWSYQLIQAVRIYLNVPYSEKECAKSFGARWDADRKSWCVPEGASLARFERWLPSSAAANALLKAGSAGGKARTPKKPRKAKKGGIARVDESGGKITIGANYKEAVGAVGLPW